MDLKNLLTFMHVAELNSFTRAGQKLGFSQSTVSFQIKQLERELGTQLFERINHTVVLTEKGRDVLKFAHQISKMTQELDKRLQNEEEVSGNVRIAMADSLCDNMLQEGFGEFRDRYPGISLKIITAGTEEMFRLLNQNEADAVLTLDNHIFHAEYVIAREERSGVHFVADSENPLCEREELFPEDLAGQPFLLTEKGMSYRRLMDEKFAELSMEILPVLEIGSAGLICSLVEQGAGISFLPDYVTEEKVRAGRLRYLPVKNFEIEIWKQLLYHRDKWVTPQLESALAYLSEREFR
ncbi:LysR family transcriptional regulator [Lachnoclostridium sp. An138]|uniref:LysR family transcriptional regulator n=1 Tax=Lachnoclostridium sp. An138 TaxID=1965560 RepID=UPI000B3762A3|nr:LysR family transcriptional regulator [Lachnoclostridium sp. An138]OUQ19612.1 hypothetical protein B5E82_05185 [Lachnoclostridium sp. An138]